MITPRSAFLLLRRLYRSVAPPGPPPNLLLAAWAELSARLMPAANPSRRSPTDSVALAGLLTSRDGLGAAARLLALELQNAEVAVSPIDLGQALQFDCDLSLFPDVAPSRAPEAIIYHANPPLLMSALALVDLRPFSHARSIGYWVWETECAPSNWRRPLRFIDEIWVPSRFSADAIRGIAPNHSIRVVPHPAALAVDTTNSQLGAASARTRLGIGSRTFVALTSFSMRSCMARKNPMASVKAFRAAFKATDDAVLVVRVRDGRAYREGLAELVQEAARTNAAAVRVMIDEPEPSLGDLYSACDVLLSLHRSEGFGLNLAEAMLHERAVVASDWSGNLDFMDADCAAMIPGQLIPIVDPQKLYKERSASWFDPSVEAAASALRKLADDDAYRLGLARAGRSRAESILSGGNAVRLLRNP